MNAFQRLESLLAVLVLGMASVSANAATGVGPYYATPSWDQTLPAATRFLILTNMASQAVLDRETGLVWEQSPDVTQRGWLDAHAHCIALTKGGRTGWRLPRVQELYSLNDPSVAFPGPTLPAGHPFSNVQTGGIAQGYWTSTAATSAETLAWFIDFTAGIAAVNPKNAAYWVWCVRGGQATDAT